MGFKRCFFLFFGLFFAGSIAYGQRDTTLILVPERLGSENIARQKPQLPQAEAISGTHRLELSRHLPYSIWVISGEDIVRYGFITLGDVLRAAPGIRVSQPGNALEGELFAMRGLSGNQYVKILIDDIPVRPVAAPGMPIGAQLPIRQAQRIEVYYGPAGVMYGNEACAGVVNIILKETERPIYAQVDLSFGNLGVSNIDVTCGGKLGRDKNIFRFSLYGSSMVRETAGVYYDENLFDATQYNVDGISDNIYRQSPNLYRPIPTDQPDAPLPHSSRMLGANLSWRGFQLIVQQMARSDASVLGLNPRAVAYLLSPDRLTDGIALYALRYQREGTRFSSRHTLSFLQYGVSNASSNTFLLSGLNTALYRTQADQLTSDTAKLRFLRNSYERYTSGTRFGAARSLETRWESTANWTINRFLSLSGGAQFTLSNGRPYTPYYRIPVPVSALGNRDLPPNATPFDPVMFRDQDMFLFGQLDAHLRRVRLMVGASTQSSIQRFAPVLLPNLAVLYDIDSTWALRGSISGGFRRPSWFAATNSFYLNNGTATPLGDIADFQTERFSAYEAGLRRTGKRMRLDLTGFWQKADFLNRNGHFNTLSSNRGYYGFQNGPRNSVEQLGVQTWIVLEQPELIEMKGGSVGDIKINWRGEFYVQYTNSLERWRTDEALDGIRMFPGWIAQMRSSWRGGNVQFMMATNRQSIFPDRAPLWAADWNPENVSQPVRRYRTWDFSLHYYLSKNFVLYGQLTNAFNRRPVGLDATGTIDDLLYNPQLGRLWRLGVHYNVN